MCVFVAARSQRAKRAAAADVDAATSTSTSTSSLSGNDNTLLPFAHLWSRATHSIAEAIASLAAAFTGDSRAASASRVDSPNMNKSSIVPELCDSCGDVVISVQFTDPNGANASAPLHFGQLLTRAQTRRAPRVSWPSEAGRFYTLLMTDPDAPSGRWPFLGEVRHWLVGNVPGGDDGGGSATSDAMAGDELTAYWPPGPPPLSGVHRYVLLVFEQLGGRVEFGGDARSR